MLEHGHNQTPNTLTSSQEVFHAKTFLSQGREQDWQESEADCFTKQCESFAKWDQDSLCWRTSQRCLFEDWTRFSGRWPRSGTMQNGNVYRRVPLVRRTSEIESSCWVGTPTASMTVRSDRGVRKTPTPAEIATGKTKANRFPTPTARDYRSGKGKTQADRGRTAGPSLAEVSGGLLNPQWVEWLMGFPIGWTDCEGLETQSCRKSQSTSDAAS